MSNGGGEQGKQGGASPTTGTSITAPRSSFGLAGLVTRLLESVGVLNKGSADSAATPTATDAAQTAGISSNALNVTRVGGLTAFIASAGAAAIAIFNVNKTTDRASIVVAAYLSVGAIVAAGLLTAAVIISSDIRARAAANPAPATSAPKSPSPSGPAAGTDAAKGATATTDASTFGDAWYRALSMLHDAVSQLGDTPVSQAKEWLDRATAAWLDAAASNGKTQNLHPADAQATLHARLSTGQASVVSMLQKLADDDTPTDAKKTDTISRINSVLSSMDQSLPWPN